MNRLSHEQSPIRVHELLLLTTTTTTYKNMPNYPGTFYSEKRYLEVGPASPGFLMLLGGKVKFLT